MKQWFKTFFTRYPIRRKATWALLIGLIGSAGTQLGIEELVPISQNLQNVLNGVWEILVIGGFLKSAEKSVTPVDDPRDNDGNQLVPATKPNPEAWI